MKRQIKRYGNAIMIHIHPQDLIDLDWEIGDWVDLSDAVVAPAPDMQKIKKRRQHGNSPITNS